MLGLAASLALTGCQRAAPPTITPVPAAAPTAEAAGGSEVALAPVPTEQADGEAQFNQFCADCHGQGAMGTDKGPPLVHQLYVPSHHGNAAFVSAAVNGVQAHHWQFGDMPPVAGITGEQVRAITLYVRWLQEQQGIR
jgi:cytochrome c5